MEPVLAKGKQAPVRVWRARAAHTAPGERPSGPVPMVGRATELDALRNIWARVVAERRPQLVTLFGPAGIGKSRLSAEFSELVGSEGARVVRGRSLPYGEVTPYGSFAAQVKQIARMFDTDPIELASEKLERAIAALLDGEADEVASHIGMLIGVGREGAVGDRQTLFFSARRLVAAAADSSGLRGHPRRRVEHARPARDARLARAGRAAAAPDSGPSRAPVRAAGLGRRAAGVQRVAAPAARRRGRARARATAVRDRGRRGSPHP
ncbi:MAG: hypothetical protein E6G36_01785 [Actinobacteria bacterium]|nr:MAG: hypothetical protein E6G36_01785 [Actinomycetota bacterium]